MVGTCLRLCKWRGFHSPPSHASVTCYGLPNQCGCMRQQVVSIEGLGEPSRGGIMGDQVAHVIPSKENPPLN